MPKFPLLCAALLGVFWAAVPSLAKTDPIILGYSACWRDDAASPADYDFSPITFLARAFLHPVPDGSLGVPDGYFNPSFETLAHQHGVKVLLSVGGGAANDDNWMSIATHPEYLQRFLDKLDELMIQHHYDGVDIDWEAAPDTTAEGNAYGNLLKSLRGRLPNAIITTALATDDHSTAQLPWAEVVANVNYVNVMTYDYAGPWGGIAAHATNLHPAGDYTPLAGHSVEEGMRNLIQKHGAAASKLLLGMNFWAYRFRADHIGDHFPKNAPGYSDDLSYQQILNLLTTGHYQEMWDAHASAPYLLRTGGGSVVVYDNPRSINEKCEYAQSLHCAGVMIWNIGADQSGEHAPLLDALLQATGRSASPPKRSILESQITDTHHTLARDQARIHGERSKLTPLPPLAGLTVDQLSSLNAQLQRQAGELNDAIWQQQSHVAGKP